eukprot:gene16267-biopygen20259
MVVSTVPPGELPCCNPPEADLEGDYQHRNVWGGNYQHNSNVRSQETVEMGQYRIVSVIETRSARYITVPLAAATARRLMDHSRDARLRICQS